MSISPHTRSPWWHDGQWQQTKLQKARSWFEAFGDCTTVWHLLFQHFGPPDVQDFRLLHTTRAALSKAGVTP